MMIGGRVVTTGRERGPSLLEAVVREPASDDLRLIYADWLEDHGDAELARFIRTQMALADPIAKWKTKAAADCDRCRALAEMFARPRAQVFARTCQKCVSIDDDYFDLVATEDELIRFNASRWIHDALPEELHSGFGTWNRPGGVASTIISKSGEVVSLQFRRGLIASVSMRLENAIRRLPGIVQRCPIEHVDIPYMEPYGTVDGGSFAWFRMSSTPMDVREYSKLPDDLIDEMAETASGLTSWSSVFRDGVAFYTKQDAEKALSDVLISKARGEVCCEEDPI